MQTTQDFAGSTDMWSTSAGGHLMKVVNLTGFTVYRIRVTINTICQTLRLTTPSLSGRHVLCQKLCIGTDKN